MKSLEKTRQSVTEYKSQDCNLWCEGIKVDRCSFHEFMTEHNTVIKACVHTHKKIAIYATVFDLTKSKAHQSDLNCQYFYMHLKKKKSYISSFFFISAVPPYRGNIPVLRFAVFCADYNNYFEPTLSISALFKRYLNVFFWQFLWTHSDPVRQHS